MKFPDFIICGFMKCGTTELWRNLNLHPDITMGKNFSHPKKNSTEIRFWNKKFNMGFEWYKQWFSGDVSGEKCANYADQKATMKRISVYCPDVKIILCVRNPVDRTHSHYQMGLHTQGWKKSFRKVLKSHPHLLNMGKYYKNIERNVLPFFSIDRVFISVQEWMWNDTNKEVNRVFEFLGVNEYNLSVSEIPVKGMHRSSVEGYRKWKSGYPEMLASDRNYLLELFSKHNENLFNFLDYKIPEWGR